MESDPENPQFKSKRAFLFPLALAVGTLAGLLIGNGFEPAKDTVPLQATADQQTRGLLVDINSASPVELMQLEGIGETLSLRIVEDRMVHGPFPAIGDLVRVSGIGPKTAEKLRDKIYVRPMAKRKDPS